MAFGALNLEVSLLEQDITGSVKSLRDINSSIDYPVVSHFRIGEATVVLNDPTSIFSQLNPDNFFKRNKHEQSGIGASIGIRTNSRTLFTGEVSSVTFDAEEGTTTIVCNSFTNKLVGERVRDFGIDRHFRIVPRELREGETLPQGEYPILDTLLPHSEDSAQLNTSQSKELNPVGNIRTEGLLDWSNFEIDREKLITEGGFIPESEYGNGFPQLRMKSPYRWERATTFIENLLKHYEISGFSILLYPHVIGPHFSTHGRVGYNLVGKGQDTPSSWEGFVTDIDYYDDHFYFLFSIARGDTEHNSRLIRYSIRTHEYSTMYTFASGIEAWQLAVDKDDGDVYVMLADSGDYNARNRDSAGIVGLVRESGFTKIADKSSTLRPQVARAYFMGVPAFFFPDNRAGFAVKSGQIYYPYFSGDLEAGIARGTTSILSYAWDREENECGCAFDIDGNLLYSGVSWRSLTNSQVNIYEQNVS